MSTRMIIDTQICQDKVIIVVNLRVGKLAINGVINYLKNSRLRTKL